MRWWFALVFLFAVRAHGLPAERFAEDTVQDATVRLAVLERFIRDDTRSQCAMRVQVIGEEVEFSAGDRVFLWLYEDDLVGDEILWRVDFEVSAEEVLLQLVDRTFDCSATFQTDDPGGQIEVYAKARVEKDLCGWTCRYDRPTTANIQIQRIEDDNNEPDNGVASARDLPPGETPDRIGRDQDWYRFELAAPGTVVFDVRHRTAAGRLEVALFDEGRQEIAAGEHAAASTRLEAGLGAGTYHVRVQPLDGDDFNFYDVVLQPNVGGCSPDVTEERVCGNCGRQRRQCDDGVWGEWSDCLGEGACAAGSTRESRCGNCGSYLQRCDDACMWQAGMCENQGECGPQTEEWAECDGGLQARICTEACTWSAFGACEPDACRPGDARQCYDGPAATVGIGICRQGEQRCVNGAWSPCDGQAVPTEEICNDGLDNNCDGATDGADEACEPQPTVGDACLADIECGPTLRCLDAPVHPQFTDGYCGLAGCERDDDCPEGICGRAFGVRYCLKACGQMVACRDDYLCADVSGMRFACLPQCTSDDDCRDPALSVCDPATGLCVFGEQDMGVAGVEDAGVRVDATEIPPLDGDVVGEPACACDTPGRGKLPAGFWVMGLLLLGARRRRHDA